MDNAFEIVEATREDLPALMGLYRQLHETDPVPAGSALQNVWDAILPDPDYHILLCRADGKLAASVSVIVIKNLTRNARPYAIIENVITDSAYRRRGLAAALMAEAVRIAQTANCYKVLLTTSRKDESVCRFYESCGFNRQDKTAYIRWLDRNPV
ncbi:MAG: GNAT family N-acetyltransferase [Bacillota bacterium]